jgi:hypothetical protein
VIGQLFRLILLPAVLILDFMPFFSLIDFQRSSDRADDMQLSCIFERRQEQFERPRRDRKLHRRDREAAAIRRNGDCCAVAGPGLMVWLPTAM